MKNIIFPDFPYKIGDEFEIKEKYQTPYYRRGIKYIIDDITYSMADDEWKVTLYYYMNSIDCCTLFLEFYSLWYFLSLSFTDNSHFVRKITPHSATYSMNYISSAAVRSESSGSPSVHFPQSPRTSWHG